MLFVADVLHVSAAVVIVGGEIVPAAAVDVTGVITAVVADWSGSLYPLFLLLLLLLEIRVDARVYLMLLLMCGCCLCTYFCCSSCCFC